MPYRVEKKDIRDISKRQAIGIKLPFSSPSVFLSTYQTIDAYKTNILNYLLTSKGDRYMNPLLGNELLNMMFEHYTEGKKKYIEHSIKEELENYFPKLSIDSLEVSEAVDENQIQLRIEFSIKDTDLSDELTVNFK